MSGVVVSKQANAFGEVKAVYYTTEDDPTLVEHLEPTDRALVKVLRSVIQRFATDVAITYAEVEYVEEWVDPNGPPTIGSDPPRILSLRIAATPTGEDFDAWEAALERAFDHIDCVNGGPHVDRWTATATEGEPFRFSVDVQFLVRRPPEVGL